MAKQDDTKNTKEPSDYYCYDIFTDGLVNEILKHDFGLSVDKRDSLIARSIKLRSFEGVFQQIAQVYSPNKDPSQEFNTSYMLGSFLDIIQLLMSWRPYERPTAKALLFSKLFKSDKYQEVIITYLDANEAVLFAVVLLQISKQVCQKRYSASIESNVCNYHQQAQEYPRLH